MAKQLRGLFDFEVGDLVYPSASCVNITAAITPFVVIERHVRETYAGTQCYYLLRAYGLNLVSHLQELTEPEIISFTEAEATVERNKKEQRERERKHYAELRAENEQLKAENAKRQAERERLQQQEKAAAKA